MASVDIASSTCHGPPADLMDLPATDALERATRLAARTLGAEASHLRIRDPDRGTLTAGAGVGEMKTTPFCDHVVASGASLRIDDTQGHALNGKASGVSGYLGVPLISKEGITLGCLCVASDAVRPWSETDLANLRDIAAGVESEIALHADLRAEIRERETLRAILDELPVGVVVAEAPGGRMSVVNRAAAAILMEDPKADQTLEYARFGAQHSDGRRYRPEEYPLSRSIVGGETVENEPMLYRRGDGTLRTLEVSSRRVANRPNLAVATFADVTERIAAAEAIARRDRRLSRFHGTTGEGLVEIGPDDRIISLNGRVRAHLQRHHGIHDADTLVGGPLEDGLAEEAAELRVHLSRARASGELQRYRRETAQGVHLDIRVVPDRDGSVLLVMRDVTEETRLAEAQHLLTQELNHRVKNLFAIVSGMVGMVARVSETPSEMARSLRDRIQALSRAHDMIRPRAADRAAPASGDVAISVLASAILSPHPAFQSDTVSFEGPAVMLSASAATNMALLFHEMATNAAKYGALSVPGGALRLRWHIEGQVLVIDWQERGGPTVTTPGTRGFGSTLIGMIVENQLHGEIHHDWNPRGLSVQVRLPVALATGQTR